MPVPLNYRLAPSEWAFIINDSQSKLLLASAEYQAATDAIRGQLETVRQYVSIGAPDAEGWTSYRAWVNSQPATPPDQYVSPEDDANQLYTSGTTGRPKGAVLTHRNQTTNVFQTLPSTDMKQGQRTLIVAPLFHAAASFTAYLAVSQANSLFIQEDFDPVEVVRVLDEERIGFALMVPAMIQACLVAAPDVAQRRYDELNCIAYGASPIAEETLRRAMDAFKCDFVQAFGMTELSPIASLLTANDHRRAVNGEPQLLLSAGRAAMGSEMRIFDENDDPVPNGTMGEIVVRGPQVMKGYWNRPDETAEALRGGWMHTGDAGTMDDEGFIYVQDRIKDMIVSGGENVYPRMVEDVLFKHPAIADAAVFGVPHEQWGETVKAAVQLGKDASATEEEIIEFCRRQLGGFECPTSVDFIDVLPRNASGKVLKRELREPYWAGYGRRVAGS